MPGQNNDSDHQLINRFFEGELSEKEEKAMDQRIQTDPAFAEKVANFVALYRAAREVRREELSGLYPEEPSSPRRFLPWWLWSLIIIGLAGGLYFLFFSPPSPTPTEPVALATGPAAHQQALNQDPGYFDEMGGSWKADYREGRYAEARRKLNALLDDSDNLSNLSRFCYYAGLLNLYPEEEPAALDRAITYLKIARPEKQDASLYLLIAYVRAGQLQDARALAAELPAEQLQSLPSEIKEVL